jgi:hypothetical protein
MNDKPNDLLQYLSKNGAATSADIQAALKLSQASVSRLVALLSDEVVKLGAGRSTLYAVAKPIGRYAAQQPIWLVNEAGGVTRIGTLTHLGKSQIHIAAAGVNTLFSTSAKSELPWYLTPLRAQGFLGQVLAKGLAAHDVDSNPERWGTAEILLSALFTHDAPGALLLGDSALKTATAPRQLPQEGLGAALDEFAQDVAQHQSAGSSAGGEQPKFTALLEGRGHVLIKFSPPRGTPYGDRWGDLLVAEMLSHASLALHGFDAAKAQIIQTEKRTYLLSERFDRLGNSGRKHLVSVGAAHAGWVKGSYTSWPSSCEALHSQGRLSEKDAQSISDIAQFGRLTGNTDMHSGNAGLFVAGDTLADIAKGRFELAPVYDMLPMRWRPTRDHGLPDYAPFSIEEVMATDLARKAARHFWAALATHPLVSEPLREVADTMAK